jgi:hypothetical protein
MHLHDNDATKESRAQLFFKIYSRAEFPGLSNAQPVIYRPAFVDINIKRRDGYTEKESFCNFVWPSSRSRTCRSIFGANRRACNRLRPCVPCSVVAPLRDHCLFRCLIRRFSVKEKVRVLFSLSDLMAFKACLKKNDIEPPKVDMARHGAIGRFRMCAGLMLRRQASKRGFVVIGGKKIAAPGAKNRGRKAKRAEAT